jgi:hypothetical protein
MGKVDDRRRGKASSTDKTDGTDKSFWMKRITQMGEAD